MASFGETLRKYTSDKVTAGLKKVGGTVKDAFMQGVQNTGLPATISNIKSQVKDAADYLIQPPSIVQPLSTKKTENKPLTLDNTSISNPVIDVSNAPVNPLDTSNIKTTGDTTGNDITNIQGEIDKIKGGTTGQDGGANEPNAYDKILEMYNAGKEQIGGVAAAPTLEEATNAVLAKFGYTPESFKQVSDLNNQLTSMNQQLADLDTKEQEEISNATGVAGTSSDFANGESARIQRKYAIQKAGLAAKASLITSQISVLQGAYDKAEESAKAYVDYATKERQQIISDIKYSMDFYKEVYEKMDASDRQRVNDLLDNNINLLKIEQDEKWAEANYNLDLWKASNTAGSNANLDTWANGLMTGQFGISNVPMGLRDAVLGRVNELGGNIISPTFAKAAKDSIAAFNTAEGMLNTIEQLAIPVTQAGNFVTANLGGILNWIGGKTGASADARLFMQEKQAFLSQLTRASGEKGVLTTQDVDRIKNALPNLNDTKEVRERKIQILKDLFQTIKSGSVSAYTTPLPSGQSTGGLSDFEK